MQESVIYQELREEARAEVRQEVRQEVQLEVERSLILRQLVRRVGTLPDTARLQVEALSLAKLELLGEALLDFSSLSDLETWFAEHHEAACGN